MNIDQKPGITKTRRSSHRKNMNVKKQTQFISEDYTNVTKMEP